MPNDIPSLGFVLWSSAKDNPPSSRFEELEPVLMDVDGEAVPGWWNNRDWFDWECSADSPDMPDRWAAMPSPPDMSDPLTVKDVKDLIFALGYLLKDERYWRRHEQYEALIARLRRALDAIGTH